MENYNPLKIYQISRIIFFLKFQPAILVETAGGF